MVGLKVSKIRDEKHRRFIASLPCCVSGAIGKTQAAHIRADCNAGMGLKSGDNFCVPLSINEHTKQHSMAERKYWGDHLMDAIELANKLYLSTGNVTEGRKLVDAFRWKMVGKR